MNRIIFSSEFLRELKTLCDNLYSSYIIVGCGETTTYVEKIFSEMLVEGAVKKDIDVLYMGFIETETVTLFANICLALRVSYFKELDTYAEVKNRNTADIIKGISLDP